MGELSVRELPLFPLPEVVLFPQEVLPLHIFESRYRIMLQSVLESDSMFGVIKWDPTTKSMANVGCCAQILKHQTAEDGRSNIITLGQQRFQVLEITRSTPFCSAMVSWINDDNILPRYDHAHSKREVGYWYGHIGETRTWLAYILTFFFFLFKDRSLKSAVGRIKIKWYSHKMWNREDINDRTTPVIKKQWLGEFLFDNRNKF